MAKYKTTINTDTYKCGSCGIEPAFDGKEI